MHTYHVLLLYPEEFANEYGETYMSDPIEAENPEEAVKKAKRDCCEANDWLNSNDWHPNYEDITTLLVVKGGEII